MSTTRREILIWSVAAVGAAAVGAGITLASGRRQAQGAAPLANPKPAHPAAWSQVAAHALPFQKPTCLAAAGGRLVVGGDQGLRWMNADGTLAEQAALASEPRALTSAPDGSVWLVRAGAVERVVAGGQPQRQAALPDTAIPTGIALGGGLLWVADFATRTVLRFHADGSPADAIHPGGDATTERFIIPSPFFPVAAGRDGLVWISHTGRHRVEGYDADGRLVRHWGVAGMDVPRFCGCCNPEWFHVLPDGRFVTAEKGQPRVKIHAADGAFVELVAGTDAFSPDVQALQVVPDGQGGLAVLDPHQRTLRIFRKAA